MDRRRRNHGSAPSRLRHPGRAVPSRIDTDRARPPIARQLHQGPMSTIAEHDFRLPSFRFQSAIHTTPMTISQQEALLRCIEHREIFHDEMLSLFRTIMSGEMSPVMIAALTMGLRVKKETVGEIAAAAQVMREFATKVPLDDNSNLLDIVGTGGDGANTFNIATAATVGPAAGGDKVAMHAGRSASSSSGSADVREALGADINLSPAMVAQSVERTGIGFMYAPNHHAAMKHA